ncbi:hypothetical protein LUQ84_002638 [Hamiltosporidium tvaerminnensis]|nr:hypothetical protein LUQ84_002638 [Hamiltosporidium tvaerminnensis]
MKLGSNSEKRIVCLSFSEVDFIVGYLSVWNRAGVSRDETVSFWSTMWNKNDKVVMIDGYLIPFVSDNHPTTFSSLDELSKYHILASQLKSCLKGWY